MSAGISNLVCDALADPPRVPENTDLEEQIQIQEQHNKKTPPNPKINDESNKPNVQRSSQNNGNEYDDRDAMNDEQKNKKPKSNEKAEDGSNRDYTVINNFVKDCTTVYLQFHSKNRVRVNNPNDASTSNMDKAQQETCKEMPEHIKKLSECQSKITNLDKVTTKGNIASNWKKVAKKLNLQKCDIYQCYKNYNREGIDEVMYHALTVWEHKNPKQATLGVLITALWASKEYECAEALATIHT